MTTDIHTLVGAYALDAVDDIERAAFDRHLRECETCRAEVDELREATARLADTTWSVPPPRLRENVLAEVARTRQLAPSAPVVPRRGQQPGRWRLAVAAAVVVAAAGTGTTVYAVQDHRLDKERAVAEAARRNEARVRDILGAPDLVVRESNLTGSNGRVKVAESRSRTAGVIVLAADAPPTDGRVYQLWTVRPGGAPQSAGVLQPGQKAILQIVEGLPGASLVGVTQEPPGGSATPTAPMVADVKLA